MPRAFGSEPEDWADKQITSKQRYQLESLIAVEEQCQRCLGLARDTMLCSGMRLQYNVKASVLYKTPEFTHSPCVKLVEKQQVAMRAKALVATCIPTRVIETWQFKHRDLTKLKCEWDSNGILCINEKPMPVAMFDCHSDELHTKAVDIALMLVHKGFTARVVMLPVLLDKYKIWNNFIGDFGENLDFLVLERYDMGVMPDFIMDYITTMLTGRVERGLPTVVTAGAAPRIRNDVDSEMYERMRDWGSFMEDYDNDDSRSRMR